MYPRRFGAWRPNGHIGMYPSLRAVTVYGRVALLRDRFTES